MYEEGRRTEPTQQIMLARPTISALANQPRYRLHPRRTNFLDRSGQSLTDRLRLLWNAWIMRYLQTAFPIGGMASTVPLHFIVPQGSRWNMERCQQNDYGELYWYDAMVHQDLCGHLRERCVNHAVGTRPYLSARLESRGENVQSIHSS